MLTPSFFQRPDTTAVLAALFDGPERGVPEGARIFCPGDISQSLFLLRRGLVKLSTLSPKGDELTLRLYRPDEIFGEGSFCRGVHRYWATAIEPSELVEVSTARAFEAMIQEPELALELVSNLADRLVSAYDEIQTVSSRIAVVRVASRLLTFPGVERSDTCWAELTRRFTHEELAQIVGVRRETLTRALARLRGLGLVECAPGRSMRLHRRGLEAFLGVSASLRPEASFASHSQLANFTESA
jgi:CRP-like cAMP-binding protein